MERIALVDGVGALLGAFAQGDVFAMGLKNHLRAGPEEGVAGEFVALLHRLEEEGVVAGVDLW